MKKTIFRLTALCLAVISLAGLFAGCSSIADSVKSLTFKKGKINGDTYKNEYFDINFKLPEGWSFATEEEMAALGQTVQQFYAEDSELKEGQIAYDMLAKAASGSSVNLQYGKFTEEEKSKSLEDIIDQLEGEMNSQLADGASVKFGKHSDVKLGSAKFLKTELVLSLYGIEITEALYAAKKGDYFCIICIATLDGSISEIEKNFK